MTRSALPPPRPTAARAPWWVWWLLAALLGVSSLGQVHRIAHGDAPTASARVAAAHGGLSQPDAQGTLQTFGHDDGSVECRLFDQLAQGDQAPATAPALSLPAGAVVAPETAACGIVAARPATPHARGPPQV